MTHGPSTRLIAFDCSGERAKVTFSGRSGESPEAVLALLRADPRVLLAEPIVGGDGNRP